MLFVNSIFAILSLILILMSIMTFLNLISKQDRLNIYQGFLFMVFIATLFVIGALYFTVNFQMLLSAM